MVMHPFEQIIKATGPLPCKNIPVHTRPQFHGTLDSQLTISVMDCGPREHRGHVFIFLYLPYPAQSLEPKIGSSYTLICG